MITSFGFVLEINHGYIVRVKAGFHLGKLLRTGTDRKVSFVLEPLVPTESSQDKGNFPVRSHPEEHYPERKPAFKSELCI